MPLYNANTKNSAVREQLTFDNRSVACKLFTEPGVLPVADADGWYIQPGTVVKLVDDYTVAPITEDADVPFGIVENGLSIADHAWNTPIMGRPVGVIPFGLGQAIIEVKAAVAITAGDKGVFTPAGGDVAGSDVLPQCTVIKGTETPETMIEVVI